MTRGRTYITMRLYNCMVTDTDARLDATFLALADPTRRAILARLSRGEASVSELASPFAMSQPAVSKHLKVLERAGLITVAQDAQRRPRRIEGRPLAEATAWLERYRDVWEASFERLDRLLEEMQRAPRSGGAHKGTKRDRPRRAAARRSK